MKATIPITASLLSFFAGASLLHAQNTPQKTDTAVSETKEAVSVTDSLKGKVHIFKDDKYVPTELSEGLEYFVIYYTASW